MGVSEAKNLDSEEEFNSQQAVEYVERILGRPLEYAYSCRGLSDPDLVKVFLWRRDFSEFIKKKYSNWLSRAIARATYRDIWCGPDFDVLPIKGTNISIRPMENGKKAITAAEVGKKVEEYSK